MADNYQTDVGKKRHSGCFFAGRPISFWLAIHAALYGSFALINTRVGCALLLDNDETVVGANVENASYGASICAERTAITRAVMQGHRKFQALAVAGDHEDPISPCGICRQFLREFGTDIAVIMVSASGHTVQHTLQELLPMSFGPENLQ